MIMEEMIEKNEHGYLSNFPYEDKLGQYLIHKKLQTKKLRSESLNPKACCEDTSSSEIIYRVMSWLGILLAIAAIITTLMKELDEGRKSEEVILHLSVTELVLATFSIIVSLSKHVIRHNSLVLLQKNIEVEDYNLLPLVNITTIMNDIITAIKNVDLESVRKLLLKQTPNGTNAVESTDMVLLNAAAQSGSVEMMQLIMTNSGSIFNIEDASATKTVQIAYNHGHYDMVMFLLQNGATLDNNTKENVLSKSFSYLGDTYSKLKLVISLQQQQQQQDNNNNNNSNSGNNKENTVDQTKNITDNTTGKNTIKCTSCNVNNECSCTPPSSGNESRKTSEERMRTQRGNITSAPSSRRTSRTENPASMNRNRRHSSYVSLEDEKSQEGLRKLRRQVLLEHAEKKHELLKKSGRR